MRGWRSVVILYLWDVRMLDGKLERGVTDDQEWARLAASATLLACGITGRIERAVLCNSGCEYQRLGSGWGAQLDNGYVRWVAFRETAQELAESARS